MQIRVPTLLRTAASLQFFRISPATWCTESRAPSKRTEWVSESASLTIADQLQLARNDVAGLIKGDWFDQEILSRFCTLGPEFLHLPCPAVLQLCQEVMYLTAAKGASSCANGNWLVTRADKSDFVDEQLGYFELKGTGWLGLGLTVELVKRFGRKCF